MVDIVIKKLLILREDRNLEELEFYRIKTQKLLRHKQRNVQLHNLKCRSLQHPSYEFLRIKYNQLRDSEHHTKACQVDFLKVGVKPCHG